MTEQKKLPSDIEENIQNLAGDIYLQIEDKITALLTSYSDNLTVSPETVTSHSLFIALKKQQTLALQQAEQSNKECQVEINTLQAEKEKHQEKLTQLQEDLSNAEKLNSAKFTDSEQILKDKLAENSLLTKQVASLNQENIEHQQRLKEALVQSEHITQQLSALENEHQSLIKNDKAKAATLSVQNQQYSELQLKYEQVSSELEYLKAEQEHKLLSSHEKLTHEQQQALQLNEQVSALQLELENKQSLLDKHQEQINSQTHENNHLNEKVHHLEQAINKLEQNNKVVQQQHEDQKQQNNKKWQDEQEKNTKILKQAADENEQIIKQKHDLERKNQVLENESIEVNNQISELKIQHLQILDVSKNVEQQLKKEQARTAKLAAEKSELAQSMAQVEQRYSKEHEQQGQKIVALTAALEQVDIEQKTAQQTINNLEQKIQAQSKEISSQAEYVKKEQLKFKQAIEKQEDNHKQMLAEHQQSLVDKSNALTELQQQADKTSTALSQQLSRQADELAAESTKLIALQQLHSNTLESIEKIEQDLTEKQQQLTLVQTELATDRAKTAKSKLLHQENKNKQELEYNKARETIKYLRDENSELNRKLDQQINELEDKLTEYRLRFEYAQKQLTKLSNLNSG